MRSITYGLAIAIGFAIGGCATPQEKPFEATAKVSKLEETINEYPRKFIGIDDLPWTILSHRPPTEEDARVYERLLFTPDQEFYDILGSIDCEGIRKKVKEGMNSSRPDAYQEALALKDSLRKLRGYRFEELSDYDRQKVAATFNVYAAALLLTERPREAIPYLNDALRADPRLDRAHTNLRVALSSIGSSQSIDEMDYSFLSGLSEAPRSYDEGDKKFMRALAKERGE